MKIFHVIIEANILLYWPILALPPNDYTGGERWPKRGLLLIPFSLWRGVYTKSDSFKDAKTAAYLQCLLVYLLLGLLSLSGSTAKSPVVFLLHVKIHPNAHYKMWFFSFEYHFFFCLDGCNKLSSHTFYCYFFSLFLIFLSEAGCFVSLTHKDSRFLTQQWS